MKNVSREEIMDTICFVMSIVIRCSLVVPFLVVSETLFFKWAENVWIWGYIATVAVTATYGVTLIRLTKRLDAAGKTSKAKLWRVVIYITGELLVALGVWLVHGLHFATLVAFGFVTWSFLNCATASRLDYHENFSIGHVVAVAVIYIGSLILNSMMNFTITNDATGFDMNTKPMVICLVIAFGCIAVLLNQSNIEELTSSRRKNALPEGVRTKNLKLVIIMVAVLLIGYIFSEPIMKGAEYLVTALLRGGYFFIKLFFLFFTWLTGLFHNGSRSEVEEKKPVFDQLGEIRDNSRGGAELVAIIITAMILLIILWKFAPSVMKKLYLLFKNFWKSIVRLFSRMSFGTAASDNNEYYRDSEEQLDDSKEEEKQVVLTKREERKRLKNARHKFDKSGGRERIRNGYSLLLEVLRYKEIPASVADTAQELPDRIEDEELALQFETVAPVYDKVRYGERDCSEEDSASFDAAVNKAFNKAISKK